MDCFKDLEELTKTMEDLNQTIRNWKLVPSRKEGLRVDSSAFPGETDIRYSDRDSIWYYFEVSLGRYCFAKLLGLLIVYGNKLFESAML